MKALYATGRYAQIRTDATPVADGLRIDFVVEKNLFNNVLRIEGLKEPPTEASALAALRMPLGEPFREERAGGGNRSAGAIRCRTRGFINRTWDMRSSRIKETQQMDVNVRISPGPRARIGTITVVNHSSLTEKDLLSRSKLKTKQEVTSARMTKATDRLRKKFVAEGYLGATAIVKRGEYDAGANRLPLTLEVTEGPRVRVQVVGAHFSKGKVAQAAADLSGRSGGRGFAAGGTAEYSRRSAARRIFRFAGGLFFDGGCVEKRASDHLYR